MTMQFDGETRHEDERKVTIMVTQTSYTEWFARGVVFGSGFAAMWAIVRIAELLPW